MCLAIPGQIEELTPGTRQATARVMGVRRTISVDLLGDDPPGPGDWVLIHVGFAMCRVSAERAEEQLALLALLGQDGEARSEAEGYGFGSGATRAMGTDKEGTNA